MLPLVLNESLALDVRGERPSMPQIELSPEAFTRVSHYAAVLGIPVEEAASKMVVKWMDETGDLVLSFLEKKSEKGETTTSAARILPMPKRATPVNRTRRPIGPKV